MRKFYRTAKWFLLALPFSVMSEAIYANTSVLISPSDSQIVQQQTKQIKGVVVDSKTGETIPGANVIVKGTVIGTSTDFDGNFKLEVPQGATLVVSYIGYNNLEIPESSDMTIRLVEDSQAIDEVVVVGYAVQKKESLTGALQQIKGDKLKDITTPSVENMLNGKIPGVYVAPGSGQPGAQGAVVIRGKASINGSSAPLWVIDGVIVGSSAGSLNPSDIENMTILKDAASTAIYGSEGANGVILVTTKKAKPGQAVINATAKMGITTLNNGNLEMMNGAELYDYYKSFSNASDIVFPRWNEDLRNSNFDWWDLATQNGFTQDYNVSLSTGTDVLSAYFSGNVYDEKGAVKGYDYTRYNFRMNIDYSPAKWITISPSVSGSKRDIKDQQYSVGAMYTMFPWDNPYNEDGTPVGHRDPSWVNSNSTNYLYDLQWNKSKSTAYEFMGNFDFNIKFTSWLTFKSVNSFRWTGSSSNSYTDPRSNGGMGVKGRLYEYQSNTNRLYTNQFLTFAKSFGSHNVSAILGYEYNDYTGKAISATGTGFVPGFEVLDVTALPEKVGGSLNEWAKQSVFLRANYDYASRYIGEFVVRRDGASEFGDNAKYGNFFSVSLAWNVAREKWFKASWVDALKVRGSYGTMGNRPSSLYPQYDLYSASVNYDGNSGLLISQVGNKDLTWETTYNGGLGIDANFFNNRLFVTFDWYDKSTDNILFRVPVSGITGVTSIWQNVGKMKNRGVELTIGGDIIRSKDWTWSLDINMGHNKNELKKLYGNNPNYQMIVSDGLGIAGTVDKLLKPGLSTDSYYIREWAGVNTETGAPQWYKTTKDGERVVTEKYAEADQVVLGSSNPKLFGGINTMVMWKNLDLNANFGYSIGGQIYNYSRQEYDSDGTYTDRNQMKLMKNWKRWEKPGDVATHPLASYNNSSNANKASSRYLEDKDYFKLRSISIGYTFRLPQYFIKQARLSFTGENLFCITDYSGVDPELPATDGSVMSSTGPSVYPSTRKYMFGLNVTF